MGHKNVKSVTPLTSITAKT